MTIRLTDSPRANVVARKIASAPRVICASPDCLEKAGTPKRPKDLRTHQCLNYGYLATGTQWKLTGKDGDHWIPVEWNLCSNNGEILRDAALEGRGIALLPNFIVQTCLHDGSLKEVLADYRAPEMSVYAMFPPARYMPFKLRAFTEFLVSSLSAFATNPDRPDNPGQA